MDIPKGENPNIVVAHEIAQKFEFYLIALVFTVLGLSVQTATFNRWGYQFIFELLAWLCLLASGLAGLSRLEWVPIAFKHCGWNQKEESTLNKLNVGLQGVPLVDELNEKWSEDDMQVEKNKLVAHIDKRKLVMKELEKKIVWKYRIHKWTFVVGIVSLAVSRGMVGLNKLIICGAASK